MHLQSRRAGLPARLLGAALLLSLIALTASPVLASDGAPAPVPQSSTPVPGSTGPVQPPDAVAGQGLYREMCAACHGQLGDGQGPSAAGLSNPPTALRDYDTVAGLSLAEMFNITKNGRMERMMPPWGQNLSDQQIWDVVGYAWSLRTTQQQVEDGKKIYDASCASCHGTEGKGKAGVPDLTDFQKTSTRTDNDWVQSVAKGQGEMPAFGDRLKLEEQRAVVSYARSLSFTRLYRGDLTGTGVITGTVINGTTGQTMPNLPVTLRIEQEDGTPLGERQATSDATGNYRFGDLPTDASVRFVVSGNYPQGVPNESVPTGFEANTTTLALPLHVFETTTDAAGIRAEQVHFIVEFAGGELQVAELYVISHDGDRTYVGDGKSVLTFSLPQDAQAVDVAGDLTGDQFVQQGNQIIDQRPLPPGSGVRQVLFRYAVPYTGSSLDLTRQVSYPAATLNALVADAGEQVASDELTNTGSRQSQMGNFIVLAGTNLKAGQAVTLKLTNLPPPGADTSTVADPGATAAAAPNPTDRIMLIGLVVLVGAGAGLLAAWPLWQRSRRAATAGRREALGSEDLVDALARLDLAHENGQVTDGEYREQRIRLKAQLLDLIRQEQAQ